MGVMGAGKTTVAQALVSRTGWQFAEGDNYHSEANRKKMHAGTPLTDADREPWLKALHEVLAQWIADGSSGVLTCSALKESYRSILSDGLPSAVVRFVLLEVPRPLLQERLEHRAGHFMNPALLDSQLATLEMPSDALLIEVTGTPEQAVEQILAGLHVSSAK